MATSTIAGLCSSNLHSTRSQCVVGANQFTSFSPALPFRRANTHANRVSAVHSTRNTPRLVARRPQLHTHWTKHQILPEATTRTANLIPHSLVPSTSSYSSSDDPKDDVNTSASSSESESSSTEAKIDLNLPRRSRLVAFTCNLCNGRSERLVNPIAWDKGLVIVKCQHCEKWHKIADAANLVEEIRFDREE
jgi:hypothetical protein